MIILSITLYTPKKLQGFKMKKLTSMSLIIALSSVLMADAPQSQVNVAKAELKTSQMDKNGIVTKESFVDVKTTIDRLEKVAKKKGIKVFLRINHAQNSRNTGAKNVLDSELLIFGKPDVGLKMLSKDPMVGLDLPLKILAYQAKDGKTYISYRDTAFLPSIYSLEGCKVNVKMSMMIDKLSSVITKSPEDFKAFINKAK